MGTITIANVVYSVYGTEQAAEDYLTAHLGAADYESATAQNRRKAQIHATRWLDRANWQGQKTVASQALQFPRTGLSDCDGNAVDSATVPLVVEEATYELMLVLLCDPTTPDSPDSGDNVKRAKAGPAEVEFHRPTEGRSSRFPTQAHELVRCFLEGLGVSSFGATGTSEESSFTCDDQFGLTQGLP